MIMIKRTEFCTKETALLVKGLFLDQLGFNSTNTKKKINFKCILTTASYMVRPIKLFILLTLNSIFPFIIIFIILFQLNFSQ